MKMQAKIEIINNEDFWRKDTNSRQTIKEICQEVNIYHKRRIAMLESIIEELENG